MSLFLPVVCSHPQRVCMYLCMYDYTAVSSQTLTLRLAPLVHSRLHALAVTNFCAKTHLFSSRGPKEGCYVHSVFGSDGHYTSMSVSRSTSSFARINCVGVGFLQGVSPAGCGMIPTGIQNVSWVGCSLAARRVDASCVGMWWCYTEKAPNALPRVATPRNTKDKKHLQSTQSAQPTNLTDQAPSTTERTARETHNTKYHSSRARFSTTTTHHQHQHPTGSSPDLFSQAQQEYRRAG